jgi:hypothetical protein
VKLTLGLFAALPVFLFFSRVLLSLAPRDALRAVLPALVVAVSVTTVGWVCRIALQNAQWPPALQLTGVVAASGGLWLLGAAAVNSDVRRLASGAVHRVVPALTSSG